VWLAETLPKPPAARRSARALPPDAPPTPAHQNPQ
jgi:hypothetical protein